MGHQNLWQFAIHTYARPGMEALCLELQDRQGVDVALLLWCLWQDQLGAIYNAQVYQRAVADSAYRRRRVRYWRRLRRLLPKWQWLSRPRGWVKQRELLAERRVLELLQNISGGMGRDDGCTQGYVSCHLQDVANTDQWRRRLSRLL